MPANNNNARNLTAEFLQEARLIRMEAHKANAEAWANGILLEFIEKSAEGAVNVLSGGSITWAKAAIEAAYQLELFNPETWQGPIKPYNREEVYGYTPTKSDRKAIGGSPDHDPELVVRYYDGDPTTGTGRPGFAMTPEENRASAKNRELMERSTRGEQNVQGGERSGYSKKRMGELRPTRR